MLGVSEREACRALGQSRGALRKPAKRADDEEELTGAIIRLATQYGRYGYRRIAALLRIEGWLINDKRVERIWRQEGLKVPLFKGTAQARKRATPDYTTQSISARAFGCVHAGRAMFGRTTSLPND